MGINYYHFEKFRGFRITSGSFVRYLGIKTYDRSSKKYREPTAKEMKAYRAQAQRIYEELKAKQEVAHTLKTNQFKPTLRKRENNNTDVKGISLMLSTRIKSGKIYFSPRFQLSTSEIVTGVSIRKHGWEKSWEMTVDQLIKTKNIPRQKSKLLQRIPDQIKLKRLRKEKGLTPSGTNWSLPL